MADIVYSFEMKHISKRFGAVEALRDVSFAVRPGTIHALCGENGAGKSALTKILAGIYPPDSGEILLRGARISFSSPAAAVRAGVAMVHQESDLAPDLTVAENIFLGVERLIGGRFVQVLDTGAMNREADDMIDCHGFMLKPDTVVADLTPAKRQQVEILKALNRKAQILILDEPTASLSLREMQELFAIIRELRNTGMAVVYISHRLDVVLDIADEVTVLRDGAQVFSGARSAVTADRVVKLMVGRELEELYPASDARPGRVFFEARELSDRSGRVSRVGFTLRRGEIVGLAGLVGSGRSETAELVSGVGNLRSGSILINGEKVDIRSPREALKRKIAFVPDDRTWYGIIPCLSGAANLLLAGEEVVADAIAAHKARLVLLAADASERTGKKTRQMAGEKLPVLVLPVDKDALGAALGKGSCAVAAVLDGGFAAKLAQMLAQSNPDYAAVAEKLDQKEAKRQRRKKEKPRTQKKSWDRG